MEQFIFDTSVILNGKIMELIDEEEFGTKPIILISKIVASEIEYQANIGKVIGKAGLDVLKTLREYHTQGKIKLKIVGKRPSLEQIQLNYGGELDALIRKDALENDATLITGDRVQYSMGIFEGLNAILIKDKIEKKRAAIPHIKLFDYFDGETMSVHLKRKVPPYAKKGSPGNWYLSKISEKELSSRLIEEIAIEIVEAVRADEHSFIEIEKKGAIVAQLREFRIVITRPPFSNDVEITAVKPLVKKEIEDYNLDARLMKRLRKAEGILICGSPGAGKSTFAAALANHYLKQNKIIKTLESVRDLQVSKEITQYAKLEGSLENSADVLLLARPDYTIFDEVRTTDDFKIYSDFRLSGVGMVGVVHSSSAIDAIQRFIGRIELGMLPSIIDTIIFIKGGNISTVLTVKMTVKVPTGFRDKDLARPVVDVKEYMSNRLMFEIYSFGQDIVINPVSKHGDEMYYRAKSGKRGKKKERIPIDLETRKNDIIISADPIFSGKNVEIYSGSRIVFTGCFSRKGDITISLDNREAQELLDELDMGKKVFARLK
jgi:ATPase